MMMDTPATLTIPADLWDRLLAEVRRSLPEEACGLCAGRAGQVETIYPIPNSLHSPTRFRMDPLEQVRAMIAIDAARQELLAIYHSHPNGSATPSETDLAEFAYPGVASLIAAPEPGLPAGRWTVRGFSLDGHQIREIRLVRVYP